MNNFRVRGLQKLSAMLDLELSYSHAKHNFELGLPLEGSLRKFFRPYFPARYGFSSGYIVDEKDTVSNQTDWIIFDAEHFAPLMAQIHGIEGAEWFPFDAIYGCIEVKRTLNKKKLNEAIEQILKTRKLTREKTNLLQVSPYMRIPEKMLNIDPRATFQEICNSLYIGIYAFLSDDYSDPEKLYCELEDLAKIHGIMSLPDFIAVHGRYYIRRATFNPITQDISINPFLEQANCYITINSEQLTAGVFYFDLLSQFANTILSARVNTLGFWSFLQNTNLVNVTGKYPYF